jgi:hypothetical protein
MKKFIANPMVFTLILVCLFSFSGAVCAGDAVAAVSPEREAVDAIAYLMDDEEVMDEVMLILEDGQIEAAEFDNLADISQEKLAIVPYYDSYYCSYYIAAALLCLSYGFDDFWCFFTYLDEILWYCSLG